MSPFRIDKKQANYLDKLGKLIEDALVTEGLKTSNNEIPVEEDIAWKGLNDVFDLGITDLSEKVDELLYMLNHDD